MSVKDNIIYTTRLIVLGFLYTIIVILLNIAESTNGNDIFTAKDGQVLYELCHKKSGSKTSFIMKSYGEEETNFKKYLLNR